MKNGISSLIAGFALVVFGVACSPSAAPVCKFERGQRVESVVGNYPGQILRVHKYWGEPGCEYTVRFNTQQTYTDSRVMSDDGPMATKPLATLQVYEYELQAPAR